MPLFILIILCVVAPNFFSPEHGQAISLFTWLIGSALMGIFASETFSGKACNVFWALFGAILAAFTVANHFSDSPKGDE